METEVIEPDKQNKRSKLDIDALEKIIGYQFTDKNLLLEAFTHRSLDNHRSYERLEFLGDKVLGFVIANMLFQQFPDADEGELSKRLAGLVNQRFLSEFADHWQLNHFIQMAQEAYGTLDNNPAIVSDITESLIGALFLDGGMVAVEQFIMGHMNTNLSQYHIEQDAKSRLQIWAQTHGYPLPDYQLSAQSGPPHQPYFYFTVSVGENQASGQGYSKRIAMQEAAENYWQSYIAINDENDGKNNDF
ncbi:MAG: ribonuclease III [Alphaproteobacteria bacterium]|nr:ribonuclease III [Alphaproteobacteria bacterium]